MIPDQSVELPWGGKKISFNIPGAWRLGGKFSPSPLSPITDLLTEISDSLLNPIGSPGLARLIKPGMKLCLVIDDGSRPTPVHRLIPALLAEIKRGGATLNQITVIPALGVHRTMTEQEVAERVGGGWFSSIKLEMHDCDDPQKLAYLGNTERGTPVYVNKTLAEADLIISVGCIEPHVIASFGGGYKNLIPGLAGRKTIAHNHTLNCQPQTYNMVGQSIEQNPMRLDLEEAGRMIKKPVFVINAVLNASQEVVKVVCGDPVQAHRAGAQVSAQMYGVPIPRLADVVITSSYPMDQDLRQGVKAITNTIRAVRPGGTLIVLVRAEEGLGVFGLANRKLPLGRNALKRLAPLLLPLVPRLKLKGMGEEDRFFLYFALQAMRTCQIYLYAPEIPTAIHENLPFVQFVPSPEKAIELTSSRQLSPTPYAIIFTHGGISYPILATAQK